MAMTGAVLGGRYKLAEQVGIGGYGEVWRATDTVLARPVAVKLLHPGYVRQAGALARFRAEARHAGALSHQNIARIYDYGEQADGQSPYLVMELVEGPSLADVLAGGALDTSRSMDIVAQAAAGLQAAHAEGLVHRDVKPANMLLAPGGTVKITDFGLAHAIGAVPVTATGELLGTPGYLAPERVTGQQVTEASDLYALGIVAYECLAGEPPFAGTALEIALAHRDRPLPPLPPSVPADVGALVMQLTAKDPAWRPGSAAEVVLRAGRLGDGQGDRDARSGGPPHLVPRLPAVATAFPGTDGRRPQHRSVVAMAAVVFAAVTGMVLASLNGFAGAPHPVSTHTSSGQSPGTVVAAQPARSPGTISDSRRPAGQPATLQRPAANAAVVAASNSGSTPGHGYGHGSSQGNGARQGNGNGQGNGKGNGQGKGNGDNQGNGNG